MELRNTVGIVTGASRGIGVAIAEALARKGVHLALAARSEEGLKETTARLERFGVRMLMVPTDVTKQDELQALVTRTEDELGPVDLVVNNAGIERYSYFQDYELDMIEVIIQTNLLAAQWLTRMVVPGMIERRKGHIVNIASVAGKTPVPFNAVYSSTKHALVGFSHSLREEMARHDVGVSVVCPGFVKGAGMFNDWSGGKEPPGLAGSVPVERVAEETVAAIAKNSAEVVVGPPLLKFADVVQAISPGLTALLGRKSGSYEFIEKVAIKAWEER